MILAGCEEFLNKNHVNAQVLKNKNSIVKPTIAISQDRTIKFLYQGYSSVLIPTKNDKVALCVSSQIGCKVGCVFCYAGNFVKNLSANNIIEQFENACHYLQSTEKKRLPTSIVFMGMGEPMHNYQAVCEAIEYMHTAGIAYKKITISTSGQNLQSLLTTKCQVAVSIHTLIEKKRKKLVPQSEALEKIIDFVHEFSKSRKSGVMLEITLIAGVTDTDADIHALLAHAWPKNVHINLIECNPKGRLQYSERMQEIKSRIIQAGYKCFIRLSRGQDIDAACGQLSQF